LPDIAYTLIPWNRNWSVRVSEHAQLSVQSRHYCNKRGRPLSGTITSVEDAAEFLAHDWRTEKGPTHLKARIACLDVMERAVGVGVARETFIDAAKESGIYLGEGNLL